MTRQWGERVGMTKCTPHRFRHTVATTLLRPGVNLRVIQRLLGHEDIKSTTLYLEVSDPDVTSAVDKLLW